MSCSAQIECEREHIICERRKSFGYDLRMGNPVYAIDEFPDDDLPWRIEWIGGLGYNTSVPSEPRIDVCLAQLLLGNPPLPSVFGQQLRPASHGLSRLHD